MADDFQSVLPHAQGYDVEVEARPPSMFVDDFDGGDLQEAAPLTPVLAHSRVSQPEPEEAAEIQKEPEEAAVPEMEVDSDAESAVEWVPEGSLAGDSRPGFPGISGRSRPPGLPRLPGHAPHINLHGNEPRVPLLRPNGDEQETPPDCLQVPRLRRTNFKVKRSCESYCLLFLAQTHSHLRSLGCHVRPAAK